jgi:hypothetical protein
MARYFHKIVINSESGRLLHYVNVPTVEPGNFISAQVRWIIPKSSLLGLRYQLGLRTV